MPGSLVENSISTLIVLCMCTAVNMSFEASASLVQRSIEQYPQQLWVLILVSAVASARHRPRVQSSSQTINTRVLKNRIAKSLTSMCIFFNRDNNVHSILCCCFEIIFTVHLKWFFECFLAFVIAWPHFLQTDWLKQLHCVGLCQTLGRAKRCNKHWRSAATWPLQAPTNPHRATTPLAAWLRPWAACC